MIILIAVAGANNNTRVAFRKCRTKVNETFINEAGHVNVAMPMYNLTENSDSYSDTSGSLWQFKRVGIDGDFDLTVDDNGFPNNLSSFNYKLNLITNRNGVKIAVQLKHLNNFWRSLEMPLVNC